jgi:hypothetical protein
MSLSSQLRHIADYIEKPPLEQKFIHPSERIKPKTLTKTQFKKICKYWFEMYPKNRTLPKYPKKKKHNMSPKWVTWLNMADELSKPKSKRKVERLKLGIVWGKKC